MSIKLYYSEPYTTTWNADVTEVIPKENKYWVTLSQTAFYPTGGGQPCDKGFIDGVEVIEVFEKDGKIFHVLTQMPSSKNVSCALDFDRRFDHMQQHSGEHLLSSIFFYKYHAHNLGFHLGEDYVSIDISLSEISSDMVKDIENTANEYIYKNFDVKTYFVDKSELKNLPLRKVIDTDEDIRIVEMGSADYCPCCGTHVTMIGEIGIIKIIKTEKNKGMTRIYFKCGKRALEDYQFKHDISSQLSSSLSCRENEIVARVARNSEEVGNSKHEIRNLKESLYKINAQEIAGSDNKVCIALLDKPFEDIKILIDQCLKLGNQIFVAASLLDNKLIAGCNETSAVNLGNVFKESVSNYGGKGGGNAVQAQASFSSTNDMKAFVKYLDSEIRIRL